RTRIVPFLLHLVDPKRDVRQDVRASALIALGKLANDAITRQLLLHYAEKARTPNLVRESATLALGLLRRTDPSLRLDGRTLDEVRDRLLALFDTVRAPTRTRAFAALALGLLADQPYGSPFSKDGRLVGRALWQRLREDHLSRDLRVALLVALGRQRPEGIADGIRAGLRRIVLRPRTLGRRWSAQERSHALIAFVRLGGPGTTAFLDRVLEQRREPREVRRAAFLAIGLANRPRTPAQRKATARALEAGLRRARDPLTKGLGHIAAGHLLAADLAEDSDVLLRDGRLSRLLLAEAHRGSVPTRGFSILALALATRNASTRTRPTGRFRAEALAVLHRGLDRDRSNDRIRSAYAVALGLARDEDATVSLRRVVEDRTLDPDLRGRAAVALGQIGVDDVASRRVLLGALAERQYEDLRRRAALALGLLGGRVVTTRLLRELETGRTERLLAQVVVALGRLGDLAAVEPLLAHASNENTSELSQALGVVALGLLADPEPRPSLIRLTRDANYPARTDATHEAYSIL
ncbi:MAG: HEAT repeat domain-containing protein, partial [Planctomycetota bacterium]